MSQADEVRMLFAGQRFGEPCAEADIQRAEAAIGEPLPVAIRELYRAFDGFLGLTDARFFWPLFGREGLVELNRFFRTEDYFPRTLISKCVFFGDNGCGPMWGLKHDLPDKVIRWDAEWGADFEVAGDSPLAVWRAEQQAYESLEREL